MKKLCVNVILDGVVMEGNLKYTGNDIKWLTAQMRKQGFTSPSVIPPSSASSMAIIALQHILRIMKKIKRIILIKVYP